MIQFNPPVDTEEFALVLSAINFPDALKASADESIQTLIRLAPSLVSVRLSDEEATSIPEEPLLAFAIGREFETYIEAYMEMRIAQLRKAVPHLMQNLGEPSSLPDDEDRQRRADMRMLEAEEIGDEVSTREHIEWQERYDYMMALQKRNPTRQTIQLVRLIAEGMMVEKEGLVSKDAYLEAIKPYVGPAGSCLLKARELLDSSAIALLGNDSQAALAYRTILASERQR